MELSQLIRNSFIVGLVARWHQVIDRRRPRASFVHGGIKDNNFGFLRLLFATLVIVSHSSELIDGNRSREALMYLTGGIVTFGEIAVDGFFIISGYLILKSYEESSNVRAYLRKRVRRIYPGFLVAFLFCVFAVAPLAGSDFSELTWKRWIWLTSRAVFLQPPDIPAFIGLPGAALNGAMWSISIEFRCYLMIIPLALLGVYKRPWLLVVSTVALLLVSEYKYFPNVPGSIDRVLGYPPIMIRMVPMFCVGTLFYLYRDRIELVAWRATIAAVGLLVCIHFHIALELAIAAFGGYLIFWFALAFKSKLFASINNGDDISYGVYLYAWPVQCLLLYYFHLRSPLFLMMIATPIVYLIGFVSWRLIERPVARTPSLLQPNA